MLSFIPSQDSQTLAFEISGTVTKEDLKKLEQAIEEQFSEDQQFNAYAIMQQPEMPTLKAIAEEAKIDMKRWSQYHKLAVVSEKNWLETMTNLSDFLPGIKAKHFKMNEMKQAWSWIKAEQ
ncbi:STAS/SEC14 domain-containing protein [Planococcus sp. CPCC 101016]|uniref:STAS/SEC14 domain-containing protein n=1 Tax=Planococcus sp. CPCC 101016 TaxID=2599617 RepID=UPI0011B5047A|nr:STAS/SEC14 domain-containing protein [Planococcus sp. CPCC 101016]TWT04426.1 STAS/SEC14 domain-containing protein [Planococcus sp. CPCC 101016]